jgi:hypothetical protein
MIWLNLSPIPVGRRGCLSYTYSGGGGEGVGALWEKAILTKTTVHKCLPSLFFTFFGPRCEKGAVGGYSAFIAHHHTFPIYNEVLCVAHASVFNTSALLIKQFSSLICGHLNTGSLGLFYTLTRYKFGPSTIPDRQHNDGGNLKA